MKNVIATPVDYYPTWELLEANDHTSKYTVSYEISDGTLEFIQDAIENYKKAQFIIGEMVGKKG